MGKLTIQDLANELANSNGVDRKEAQDFVAALFQTIQDGVERDKIVKVKGLGTFKVVDVEARESVNVNTGERVLIDSHSKISFTPDNTMKELVNKPFSNFETVALNEGVSFDELEDPKEEPAEEPVIEVVPEVVKETVSEPVPEVVKETVQETAPETVSDVVEDKVVEPVIDEVASPIEETPEEPSASSWWKWLLALLVGLIVGAVVGFYVGKNYPTFYECVMAKDAQVEQTEVEDETTVDTLTARKDSLTNVDSDSWAAMKESMDSLVAKKDSTATVADAQSEPQKETAAAEHEYKKWDAMDVRVRLGAYAIVGLDRVEKARQGDDLARFSRRYLGADMVCYLEVYNGMKASDKLEAGQEIKLPKLKLKKYLKDK